MIERNLFHTNTCLSQEAPGKRLISEGDLEFGGLGEEMCDPNLVELRVRERSYRVPGGVESRVPKGQSYHCNSFSGGERVLHGVTVLGASDENYDIVHLVEDVFYRF